MLANHSALGSFPAVQDCTLSASVVLGPLHSPSLGCARQFQLWTLAVWESLSTMKVLSNFHNLFQLSTSPCRCSGVGLYDDGYSGCDKYIKGFSFSSLPSGLMLMLNCQLSGKPCLDCTGNRNQYGLLMQEWFIFHFNAS